jgi:hypothetical protein
VRLAAIVVVLLGCRLVGDISVQRKCIPATRCCRICTKGKACGNSCINVAFDCHTRRGCACASSEVCPNSPPNQSLGISTNSSLSVTRRSRQAVNPAAGSVRHPALRDPAGHARPLLPRLRQELARGGQGDHALVVNGQGRLDLGQLFGVPEADANLSRVPSVGSRNRSGADVAGGRSWTQDSPHRRGLPLRRAAEACTAQYILHMTWFHKAVGSSAFWTVLQC